MLDKEFEKILFPEPPELKPNIYFWLAIYTRYQSYQGIVHDSENLNLQYEVIDFNKALKPGASWRSKKRFMEKRKRYYQKILRRLARQNGVCDTKEECRVASFFGYQPNGKRLKRASRSVRVQFGLADRFRKGLITSGLYINEMWKIFKSHGLPEQLLALPHVESSFNLHAYSKAGAAGIWQFTRSTGRLYLKINYSVDERRDPFKSTVAAAKLLKRNYAKLGNWPLAITAYNHGGMGMFRAKKLYGDDLVSIIKNYKSRSFGFASKNFYAEFLAAKKVAENPERYFGPLNFNLPLKYNLVKTKHFIPASLLTGHMGYRTNDIIFLNPSLRHSIWDGTRRIPRNYELKVPFGTAKRFEQLYATAPNSKLFARQIIPDYYTVRRGDTLSVIARRFRTSMYSLQTYNDLHSRHRIYAGQKLRIPPQNKRGQIKIASASAPAEKKIKPVFAKFVEPVEKRTNLTGKPFNIELEDGAIETVSIPIQPPPISNFGFIRLRKNYGIIRVEPEETLGHYSYWSGVSVRALQKVNGWKRRRQIRHGQLLKIPLTSVTSNQFVKNRYEYNLGLFEDFFTVYKIERVKSLVVAEGQTLWALCNKANGTPIWLVALYNRDQRLDKLQLGQKIRMPIIEKR